MLNVGDEWPSVSKSQGSLCDEYVAAFLVLTLSCVSQDKDESY